MLMLALDCGNSRLKWGIRDGAHWLSHGLFEYTDLAGLPALLRSLPAVERAVVANVAGARIDEAVGAALASLAIPAVWVQSRKQQCGVRSFYDNPEQLGADRWAALIGARHVHQASCLVVNAGTATTVDVLDLEGNFQGGLILPGVRLMLLALARNTAQLPVADGRFAGLPRNTADAIASGCLQAQVGAVERMFVQVAGCADAICLVSGGAADGLFALLGVPKRRVDNLVLEGLACIGLHGEAQ
jgi:type III pantothenate kinase